MSDIYYLTYCPGNWLNVFKDGPLENPIKNNYREAFIRKRRYRNIDGKETSIYVWNNSFWFKTEADSVREAIKKFCDVLDS